MIYLILPETAVRLRDTPPIKQHFKPIKLKTMDEKETEQFVEDMLDIAGKYKFHLAIPNNENIDEDFTEVNINVETMVITVK